MAKKEKEIITEDGHTFDSHEELYFYWWVKELMDNGYVKEFTPHPKSFPLSSGLSIPYIEQMKKVENKELWYNLIQPSVYTPDAQLTWTSKGENIFYFNLDESSPNHFEENVCKDKKLLYLMISHGLNCFIEVKPIFDQNNMTMLARTNIKWVWENHETYVNMVIPQKLFAKTFTPKRYLTSTKSNKPRKIHFKVQSLQEYIGKFEDKSIKLL